MCFVRGLGFRERGGGGGGGGGVGGEGGGGGGGGVGVGFAIVGEAGWGCLVLFLLVLLAEVRITGVMVVVLPQLVQLHGFLEGHGG